MRNLTVLLAFNLAKKVIFLLLELREVREEKPESKGVSTDCEGKEERIWLRPRGGWGRQRSCTRAARPSLSLASAGWWRRAPARALLRVSLDLK